MSQLQITFRGMLPSENLCALAAARFLKVRLQCADASRCHVVIEQPSADGPDTRRFSARVHLLGNVQGVQAAAESRHVNANIAVREAFERASAQVADGAGLRVQGTTHSVKVTPPGGAQAPARRAGPRPSHLTLVR
jgi:hypothetical protein